jgi:hypothetical protein
VDRTVRRHDILVFKPDYQTRTWEAPDACHVKIRNHDDVLGQVADDQRAHQGHRAEVVEDAAPGRGRVAEHQAVDQLQRAADQRHRAGQGRRWRRRPRRRPRG